MAISVKNKIAIITGATKGIGRGIANAFAASGATVVVVSRHLSDCEQTAFELQEKYGTNALGIAADITKQEDINCLVQSVIDAYGHIDVLINNAGSAITKCAEDVTEQDWDYVINLDLKAVFFCSQAVGKRMIEQKCGKIINISSALGIIAEKQILPYLAAKAGVLHMTKGLALEWAQHNIHVNSICPGYVITDINRELLSNEKVSEKLLKKFPLRRFGEVEEIADAAVFLASDASSYMTGQQIVIDGGWTIQ